MPNKEQYLARTQQILKFMASQNIQLGRHVTCDQDRLINRKLTIARQLTEPLTMAMEMPGLTGALATTYLQVGLCMEMAQRFAFEYIKAFHDLEVSLVFLNNPANLQHDNHAFVLAGPIAPKILNSALITGKKDLTIDLKNNTELYAFLQDQLPNCILVDPFLGFSCYANERELPEVFLEFCQSNHLSQVIAVKLYQNSPYLHGSGVLAQIESNAQQVAEQIKSALPLALKTIIGTPIPLTQIGLFSQPLTAEQKMQAIIRKYTKSDVGCAEQALRRAAATGNLSDVQGLVDYGVNIDAAASGKTALAWAIERNHMPVVDYLNQVKATRLTENVHADPSGLRV